MIQETAETFISRYLLYINLPFGIIEIELHKLAPASSYMPLLLDTGSGLKT